MLKGVLVYNCHVSMYFPSCILQRAPDTYSLGNLCMLKQTLILHVQVTPGQNLHQGQSQREKGPPWTLHVMTHVEVRRESHCQVHMSNLSFQEVISPPETAWCTSRLAWLRIANE